MGNHHRSGAPRSAGQLAYDARRADAKRRRLEREAEERREAELQRRADAEAKAATLNMEARQLAETLRVTGGMWIEDITDPELVPYVLSQPKIVRVMRGIRPFLVYDAPLV